ncbi:hypothetical protein Fmac_023196 [Flemingia macrophylla]|uniref:Uncharacterized protein n=1 Tax=Flemingia macrophylla TaxID=520843 RepID=A0ABD1LLC2_9FABA
MVGSGVAVGGASTASYGGLVLTQTGDFIFSDDSSDDSRRVSEIRRHTPTCESNPSAAKWRTNAIRYYDLMEELWGADRATGHMARTARQTRTNIGTSSFRVDLNDDFDNIPEEQPFHPGFDTSYRSPHMWTHTILVMELNQYHLAASSWYRWHIFITGHQKKSWYAMASSSKPSRKRSSKERKGKSPATASEHSSGPLPSIEDALNQARFFDRRDQMIKYGAEFYHEVVLPPKCMDFQYFAKSSFYFQHHLQFQGLHHFLSIHTSYFQDLIKVFYSNLTLTEDGHLYTEVNKTKIHIKPTDWLTLAGLKYQGIKLNLPDIPDDLDYDRATTLTSMTRPHM